MKKTTILLMVFMTINNFLFAQNNKNEEFKQLKKEYQLLKEQTINQEKNIQKEYDFLKTQTAEYKEFIEKEREQHQAFLEWSYGVSGGIIAVLLGVLSFFGYRTRQDMRATAQREIELAIKKVKSEIPERVNDAIDDLVSSNIKPLKEKSKVLSQKIESLTKFYHSKIMLINKNPNYKELSAEIYTWLVSRGFNKENIFSLNQYKEQDVDFVVYFYNPTEKTEKDEGNIDKDLQKLIETLQKEHKTPIVVYNSTHIHIPDKELLDSYGLYYLANSELSLKGNIKETAEITYIV